MPRLRATLGAKGARRAPKTRSPRWSWASRGAGSSRSLGSSRQPTPTPSRTAETPPRSPPTRRQRRGSPLEGFLKALYVDFSSFFSHSPADLSARPAGPEPGRGDLCSNFTSRTWAKEQRDFGKGRKSQASGCWFRQGWFAQGEL